VHELANLDQLSVLTQKAQTQEELNSCE
jgi:hypothetical protein